MFIDDPSDPALKPDRQQAPRTVQIPLPVLISCRYNSSLSPDDFRIRKPGFLYSTQSIFFWGGAQQKWILIRFNTGILSEESDQIYSVYCCSLPICYQPFSEHPHLFKYTRVDTIWLVVSNIWITLW